MYVMLKVHFIFISAIMWQEKSESWIHTGMLRLKISVHIVVKDKITGHACNSLKFAMTYRTNQEINERLV